MNVVFRVAVKLLLIALLACGPASKPACTHVTVIDDCFEDGVVWFDGGVPASDRVDAAIALVRARAEIEQVEARGFREATEPATRSQERADRVRARFLAAGIAANRVIAIDGGVDDASTLAGYARRVSVLITKQRFSAGTAQCTLIGPIYRVATVSQTCS